MTVKNKTTNIVKQAKQEVAKDKREAFSKKAIEWMKALVTSYVFPFIQVVLALLALTIILGLAYKGARVYLSDINETQRTIAAIVAVVLLSYCVSTGLKRIFSK